MASESPVNGVKASPKNIAIDNMTDTLSKVQMDDENDDPFTSKSPNHTPRKLVIYPRPHLLMLHKSPLVKPPEDMPALKDWFGTENEQSMHKKEPDGSSPTRERRFRRDQEDADTPSRPSYRGALAQPSQMGNFKHQSLRSVDRGDRDKDGEKERERDIRDKEGQDRLRHLSDKYDRDRLALPSNSTNLRNKDRDLAPHLGAGSSRLTARERESTTNSTSRRPEPGSKKKLGETSEDWRRGTDFGRSGRDDRSEISRRDRDRDDRDRPRSRVRDLSRPRRERSSSRRDRDRDDRDRRGDRDRDDYRRDDYRRERDEYPRRDRDSEKDADTDDPRRWRDDGKRDERAAARRDREYRERTRDRPPRERDDAWDDRHGGRWTVVEERDSRNKRSSGRDRRSGVLDDVKDKDDRRDDRRDRDRDRGGDREKEKEPAWMDTYIPSGPGTGILGTKAGEGELDGIQAFKKGMKAKEQKDAPTSEDSRKPQELEKPDKPSKGDAVPASQSSENPLDEIQLFKLMMKKEQSHKTSDESPGSVAEQGQNESALPDLKKAHDTSKPPPQPSSVTDSVSLTPKSTSTPTPSTRETSSQPGAETPQTLLSILSSASTGAGSLPPLTTSTTPSLESGLPKPSGSRFFPKPLSSDLTSPIISDNGSSSSQVPPQFNPPAGSRLLAFGARNQAGTPHATNPSQPPQQTMLGSLPQQQHHGLQSSSDLYLSGGMAPEVSQRQNVADAMRAQQGYSPFELQSRAQFAAHELHDNFGQDSLRRTPIIPPGFSATSESSSSYSNNASATSETFGVNGPGSSLDGTNGHGKGSRFLKYFEEKGRDGQVPRKTSGTVGFQSSSPVPNMRQDAGNLGGMPAGHADNRAMDDLFAMLNTSVQGQRGNPLNQMNAGPMGGQLGQNNMQHLHHQQLHHQQIPPQNRLDSLYDSRLDDRNFVPDGMVPGLRQAPPPRSRESNGMFADPLDDPMQFDPRRLPPHQRGLDPSVFQGAAPSMYNQQGNIGRSAGLPVQQPQFRNNASPNPIQGPGQQRLPPGLANLGGRPPHEPGQFMGQPGMQMSGVHGPLAGNGPGPQPPFNNFANNGNNLGGNLGGFAGNPQMRGGPLPGGHHLSNSLGPNQMVLPGDLRGPTNPNQVQLMNLGGPPNMGGNMRNAGGFGGPQQGPLSQMQQPMNMRQQQPQHQPNLQPHMMPHQAHHISNPQQPGGGAHTQELMALLLGGGGPHRE